jgi:hypothetical protein
MNTNKILSSLLLGLAILFTLSGCTSSGRCVFAKSHTLVGAWKASDDTLFIFRNDGSFYGVDWKDHEIWGNWVQLSPKRIGFQSLRHDSFYNPQYAVISNNENVMNYIVTGGTRFIKAERITIKQAEAAVEKVLEGKIILPAVEE